MTSTAGCDPDGNGRAESPHSCRHALRTVHDCQVSVVLELIFFLRESVDSRAVGVLACLLYEGGIQHLGTFHSDPRRNR